MAPDTFIDLKFVNSKIQDFELSAVAPLATRSLTVAGVAFHDIQAVSTMHNLTSLTIKDASVKSLDPIAGLRIKKLTICNCALLGDVKAIETLSVLQALRVVGCNLNRLTLPEDSSVAHLTLMNCEIGELEMTDSQYAGLNACVFTNVSLDEEHLRELRRKVTEGVPVRVENGMVWVADFK